MPPFGVPKNRNNLLSTIVAFFAGFLSCAVLMSVIWPDHGPCYPRQHPVQINPETSLPIMIHPFFLEFRPKFEPPYPTWTIPKIADFNQEYERVCMISQSVYATVQAPGSSVLDHVCVGGWTTRQGIPYSRNYPSVVYFWTFLQINGFLPPLLKVLQDKLHLTAPKHRKFVGGFSYMANISIQFV